MKQNASSWKARRLEPGVLKAREPSSDSCSGSTVVKLGIKEDGLKMAEKLMCLSSLYLGVLIAVQ